MRSPANVPGEASNPYRPVTGEQLVSSGSSLQYPVMNRRFLKLLTLVALLMLFIFGGNVSAADIFVYKGTVRIRGSLNITNQVPPLVRSYIIIDFETGEGRQVSYFVKDGKKQLNSTSPFQVTRATLANAKTATVICYGSSNTTGVNHFNLSAVVLRGTDVSVKLETAPTRTVVRPRILSGVSVGASSETGVDGSFQSITYNAVLHSALTIDANNNDKSVLTVANEISAALTEQGYQLPPPEE
jgi:hypothetical protein